jgi:predicted dehydrogenase
MKSTTDWRIKRIGIFYHHKSFIISNPGRYTVNIYQTNRLIPITVKIIFQKTMNKTTDTSFSRRSFLVTGGIILLNGCAAPHYRRPIENESLKPFTIGFVGKDDDFQFYAQILKNIPSVVFEQTDNKTALQGQHEAVVVAAPLKKRAELAKQILNHSHLLIQTPMATSYQEFDAIMQLANQQNKRVAITSFHRFLNAAKQARTLIDEIGKIKTVVMQVSHDTSDILLSHQQPGFIGKALPLFDLVRWLCAKSPLSLSAHKNLFARFDKPEKNLHLLLELGNIPLLYTTKPSSLSASWTITLYGQQSHLKLTADGQLQRADFGADWQTVSIGEPEDFQQAMHDLLADFVDSCRTGKEPEVNVLDGMAGIALTLAAVQSAQTGQTVSMVEQPIGVDEDKIWRRESRRLEKEKRKIDSDSAPNTPTGSSFQKPLPIFETARYLSRRHFFQTFQTTVLNRLHPLEIADRIARRVMNRYQVYSSYTTDLALEGLLYLFDATEKKSI